MLLGLSMSIVGWAQPPGGGLDDESDFYAETKQLNQFFRRFNAEESPRGDRYYPGDSAYRDINLRREFITRLFDKENTLLSQDIKDAFVDDVCGADSATWLEFHGDQWFAEVHTRFKIQGKSMPVTLYMELEAAPVGYKWVIRRAYAPFFDSVLISKTPGRVDSFLHPLSHELEFMNLGKVFRNRKSLGPFLAKDRRIDHLTLLLQAWEKGSIRYETVTGVSFHFFQIQNRYFEVAYFNRASFNKGWLISKLTQIDEDKKHILEAYIVNGQP